MGKIVCFNFSLHLNFWQKYPFDTYYDRIKRIFTRTIFYKFKIDSYVYAKHIHSNCKCIWSPYATHSPQCLLNASNRNDKHDTHATWIRLHAHDCRHLTLPQKQEKQAGTAFTPHSLSIQRNNTKQSTLFQSTVMRVMIIDAKNHRQL
jgi:hypothetical protein